jgi:hypothetical protein
VPLRHRIINNEKKKDKKLLAKKRWMQKHQSTEELYQQISFLEKLKEMERYTI